MLNKRQEESVQTSSVTDSWLGTQSILSNVGYNASPSILIPLARNKQYFNCSLEKYRRQLSTTITLLGAVNLPSNLARGFSY